MVKNLNKGSLIVIEGMDGIGKSTLIKELRMSLLSDKDMDGHEFIFTKEPGGCKSTEKLRALIMNNNNFTATSNYFLMLADRFQHLDKGIYPNINKGINVVCDRFNLSTLVYNSFDEEVLFERSYKNKIMNFVQAKISAQVRVLTIFLNTSNLQMISDRLVKRNKWNKFDPRNIDQIKLIKDRYELCFKEMSEFSGWCQDGSLYVEINVDNKNKNELLKQITEQIKSFIKNENGKSQFDLYNRLYGDS